MKRILLLIALSLCLWSVAEAKAPQTQPSKEYVETLKKMITVSGGDATFKMVVPQMFAMMKLDGFFTYNRFQRVGCIG